MAETFSRHNMSMINQYISGLPWPKFPLEKASDFAAWKAKSAKAHERSSLFLQVSRLALCWPRCVIKRSSCSCQSLWVLLLHFREQYHVLASSVVSEMLSLLYKRWTKMEIVKLLWQPTALESIKLGVSEPWDSLASFCILCKSETSVGRCRQVLHIHSSSVYSTGVWGSVIFNNKHQPFAAPWNP